MSLSYHYSFRAPAETTAAELGQFLRQVEGDARLMGFGPTIVISGPFDTPERRDFARRTVRGLTVEDARLRGVTLDPRSVWLHVAGEGVCRLAPEHGVLLVLTDERGRETVFGFCRFPSEIRDAAGRVVMTLASGWSFGGFVDSPDQRYRAIVRRFAAAGFVADEHDEFSAMEKVP